MTLSRKESGSLGGKATLGKLGKSHMVELGKRGFAATVNRHWNGDKAGYLAHQRQRANQAVIDALADIRIQAEQAGGKEVSSVELPVYVQPDDDPFFHYDGPSWQVRVEESRQDRDFDPPF